jgi:predicted MFS family arabinose efflux permease
LASPSLNAKVGALALCRASHFVFACAMLVCGLTSDITTMAASRFVAGVAAGFGVFSIFLIVFDATKPEKRSAAGSFVWSGIGVAIVASGLASGPILDGGAWRLSFIVPAALALAVAVFIPRTASAARTQPQAAAASPPWLAELISARWIFLVAAYFLFGAGYISYVTFAGVMLEGIGLSSVGVTWFWVIYGASSIAGAALGAALLSGAFARRIALSAALGSGAIGSLLAVHSENWSVSAASVLVGLGSVATPAIVTFLIRNRTSDAAYPFFFTVGTASLGLGQLCGPAVGGILADLFSPSAIGWFAAAIYGAGMLAAAADGFFGWTRIRRNESGRASSTGAESRSGPTSRTPAPAAISTIRMDTIGATCSVPCSAMTTDDTPHHSLPTAHPLIIRGLPREKAARGSFAQSA